MKNIKNYFLALVILSLSANTLPRRGRVAAFAVGTSVGRNNSNYDESDKIVSRQIKRHESEIAKNNKKLSSKKLSSKELDNELDVEVKQQRLQEKNDLLASNKEHERAIQDLVKKQV